LQIFPLFWKRLIGSNVKMLPVTAQLEIKWLQLIENHCRLSVLDLDTDKHPIKGHVDPMVYSRCLNVGVLDRLPHFVHQPKTHLAVTLVCYHRAFAMQSEPDWFVNDFYFHCLILSLVHGYVICLFRLRPPYGSTYLPPQCLDSLPYLKGQSDR